MPHPLSCRLGREVSLVLALLGTWVVLNLTTASVTGFRRKAIQKD